MTKKGSKKSPIQPRTKEQIALDIKRAESKRLIIDTFYPALVEATTSVDEAGMLLQAVSSLIMEEAMVTLREKKIKDIKSRLVKKLCPDGDRLLQIEALIDSFDNLSLFETRGHFESMKAVVEQMKIDEFQKRTLKSLTPDWERYLQK